MIELFHDILKALYKPLLVLLVASMVALLWYIPREDTTSDPIWVEVIANPKTGQCEVTLWEGNRIAYSLVSDRVNELNKKVCQIYVLNH